MPLSSEVLWVRFVLCLHITVAKSDAFQGACDEVSLLQLDTVAPGSIPRKQKAAFNAPQLGHWQPILSPSIGRASSVNLLLVSTQPALNASQTEGASLANPNGTPQQDQPVQTQLGIDYVNQQGEVQNQQSIAGPRMGGVSQFSQPASPLPATPYFVGPQALPMMQPQAEQWQGRLATAYTAHQPPQADISLPIAQSQPQIQSAIPQLQQTHQPQPGVGQQATGGYSDVDLMKMQADQQSEMMAAEGQQEQAMADYMAKKDQTEHVAMEEWKAAAAAQGAKEHEKNRKETANSQVKRLQKKQKEDAHWAAKHPQELAMIKNIPGASAAMAAAIPEQHTWRQWLPDSANDAIGSIARQTGMPLGKVFQPEAQATMAAIASSPLPGSPRRKSSPPLDPSCQPPTCFPAS